MQEIGKTILFYINKIENNTIYITEVLQTTNKTIKKNSEFLSSLAENLGSSNSLDSKMANNGTLDYDSAGAAKYIIVVVLLYGFGIIFFIGSQVRSTQKYSDDIEGVNAEKILRSMDTVIFTKEVMGLLKIIQPGKYIKMSIFFLEKLSNKELREKAWKIYLDDKPSPDSIKESVTEAKHLLKIKTSENLDKEPLNNIDQKPQIFKIQHTDKTQTVNESKSGDKIRDFLNKKKSIEKKS